MDEKKEVLVEEKTEEVVKIAAETTEKIKESPVEETTKVEETVEAVVNNDDSAEQVVAKKDEDFMVAENKEVDNEILAPVTINTKEKKANRTLEKKIKKVKEIALFVVLCIVAFLFIAPVIIVAINSFKTNSSITHSATSLFAFPTATSFAGFENYKVGMTFGAYPFFKAFVYSVIITVTSVALILLCTSMAAWYIGRVNSLICKIIYYLCIFSMVVPFQMVMYTLSKTADSLHLNTPYTICIIYLGFGAGMAIFMFTNFIKSIPLEIEEAASIDGCNPLQTFFRVVLPICKPTMISLAILEIMWIWNDYLLPYLSLDITKYRTLPIHVQYLQGSYGRVDFGATMAIIMMCLLPVIIIYIVWQKHIIKGVVDGAVK